MIISVFGLRDFGGKEYVNYEHVAQTLDTFEDIETIISGGGKGIETLASRYASENNIPVRIVPPHIAKYGAEEAFSRRNTEIIEASDMAIVFWDGKDTFYIELVKSVLSTKKYAYVVPIL